MSSSATSTRSCDAKATSETSDHTYGADFHNKLVKRRRVARAYYSLVTFTSSMNRLKTIGPSSKCGVRHNQSSDLNRNNLETKNKLTTASSNETDLLIQSIYPTRHPCRPHHRTKTRARGHLSASSSLCKDCINKPTTTLNNTKRPTLTRHNKFCQHLTFKNNQTTTTTTAYKWILIHIALIYVILLTSTSVLKHVAQASAPTAAANNYWPLVHHQHRYQQLFFTSHQRKTNQNQKENEEDNAAEQQPTPINQMERRSFDTLHALRQQHQRRSSTAAVAAAAAAIAATASAARARASQSHNLLIGQNFNNFSSIIPYSIVHDVDYGPMQEDPLVSELNEGQQQQQATRGDTDSSELMPSQSAQNSMMTSGEQSMTASETQHQQQQQQQHPNVERALLDSSRLRLPQMQQIKARFNQGCVGGTKCQFFAFCWMSGGSLGASCGLLMTCCVTPSRQEIQPGFYGPVVNDPYCGRSTSKINRIVGGTDASFGQFPWQAFVQVGGSRCGGALISSRHVVTAGHCVARSQHSPSSIKVTLGDYILNSDIESIPHEVYSVVEVYLHPNFRFTPQADRYDVAVLELDRAASYKDNIKPICLPQKDATFVGRVAYVAGWGALQAGSKLRPKVLQHVAVPVVENNVCETWHRRKGIDIRIYDEMMCAGHELGQRDACQGDSGGPLMLNQFGVWYLVGIVSAGYSCAKQYQPGIYHRVSSSSDWISSNVYQQGNSN